MKYDVFKCIVMFFRAATGILRVLNLFGTSSIVMATVLIALCNGAVHGINALQTSYLPTVFKRQENISLLAGILNSATYVGSALSIYLFALISEQGGWNDALCSWLLIALVGLVFAVLCWRVMQKDKVKK